MIATKKLNVAFNYKPARTKGGVFFLYNPVGRFLIAKKKNVAKRGYQKFMGDMDILKLAQS